MEKKIAGVVVLYNATEKEIDNIYSYIDNIEKLYVIDNSATDKAKEFIKSNEKIIYIPNYTNLGVATALNNGAKRAIQDGYKWLLTMDQDTNFIGNSFEKFIKALPTTELSMYGIIAPWHKTKLKDLKPIEDIDFPMEVMTSANLLNLDIYQKIGGFTDWYFIDGVDMDYCYRLRMNGYEIMRINTIEIEHNLGDIVYKNILGRKVLLTNHNYIRRYYIARNYLYIKKMYSNIDPYHCDINARQRRWIIKIILFEKDKYRKIKSIILGKIDYYRGVKGKKNGL